MLKFKGGDIPPFCSLASGTFWLHSANKEALMNFLSPPAWGLPLRHSGYIFTPERLLNRTQRGSLGVGTVRMVTAALLLARPQAQSLQGLFFSARPWVMVASPPSPPPPLQNRMQGDVRLVVIFWHQRVLAKQGSDALWKNQNHTRSSPFRMHIWNFLHMYRV